MEETPKTPQEPRAPRKPTDARSQQETARMNQRPWVMFMLVMVLLFIGYHYLNNHLKGDEIDVTFNELLDQLADRNVETLEGIDAGKFRAILRKERELAPARPENAERRPTKRIVSNVDNALIQDLIHRALAHDTKVIPYDAGNQLLAVFLLQILPFVVLIGIFWYMTSRVRRQMGPGLFGRFTGNRAKRYEKGKDPVTFQEVAGLKNVKTELQEVVEFLKNPERFTRVGAKIPKGVLLVGPPGTGKTLLARAVAGEAGVPFFSISGSEFIELFVGVGASRVRELFDEAKKNAPCIVFIDEIDAVGRSRGTGLGGGHDEREQTLNQILSEMDGFESNQAVIVLAATNRPDVLDPALVRPGRFDRQVVVERPQKEGRQAILKVHTRKVPLAEDVDLEQIARGTIGFSGADLQNLANEAALLAAREGHTVVAMRDFERAKDKIMLGTLRDERMNEKERKVTAYHEAGHAILALMLPEADPVHSVTIVPRGRALGVTQIVPEEDKHNYTRRYLMNSVVVALGGRAAEHLIFEELTTGAENDLERATDLVEKMVCRWGMSSKLGPVSFRRGAEHVFLGRELGEHKTFSEHTAMLIDDEIRHFLDGAQRTASEILQREKQRLVLLAEALLEREAVMEDEIYELLDLPKPARLLEKSARAALAPPKAPGKAAAEAERKPADELNPDLLGLEGA